MRDLNLLTAPTPSGFGDGRHHARDGAGKLAAGSSRQSRTANVFFSFTTSAPRHFSVHDRLPHQLHPEDLAGRADLVRREAVGLGAAGQPRDALAVDDGVGEYCARDQLAAHRRLEALDVARAQLRRGRRDDGAGLGVERLERASERVGSKRGVCETEIGCSSCRRCTHTHTPKTSFAPHRPYTLVCTRTLPYSARPHQHVVVHHRHERVEVARVVRLELGVVLWVGRGEMDRMRSTAGGGSDRGSGTRLNRQAVAAAAAAAAVRPPAPTHTPRAAAIAKRSSPAAARRGRPRRCCTAPSPRRRRRPLRRAGGCERVEEVMRRNRGGGSGTAMLRERGQVAAAATRGRGGATPRRSAGKASRSRSWLVP